MEILGVRIDNFSEKEALEKVKFFLQEDKFHHVATINPEFVLLAQKDAAFKDIVNNCELCLADGIGIWFSHLRFGKILKNRVVGADLTRQILEIAHKEKMSVFIANSNKGLSRWEEIRNVILEMYPDLNVRGANLDKNRCDLDLSQEQAQILFCNFGAPHQEKLIHSLKSQKNSKIRLAVGVGGSFDFLTGKIRRAPKIFQKIGLEWLWRFFQEPRYRARRIFRAVIIFPIRILFSK
jgi:N-acetylglucosaminyldiphosphoundecaprenol N-acetyl-beta-D-mannosaminyltransferase